MSSRRVVMFALGTQALLIAAAWGLSRLLGLPPEWGQPGLDIVTGVAAALGLAILNYSLLVHAPANWLVDGVRSVYRDLLLPLFGQLRPPSILAIGAAAGLGEEWLFRGVAQPVLGLVGASVAFGLAHIGGRRMWAFGVWATLMGLVLGGLAIATEGLMAPVVAHGLYDMLALEYIRRGGRVNHASR